MPCGSRSRPKPAIRPIRQISIRIPIAAIQQLEMLVAANDGRSDLFAVFQLPQCFVSDVEPYARLFAADLSYNSMISIFVLTRNFGSEMRLFQIRPGVGAHILAAGCALLYALYISQSAYVKTGMQFVAPLLVVMSIHFVGIMITSHSKSPGFAAEIFRRSVQTTFGMVALLFSLAFIAPLPAQASAGGVLGGLLIIVFCGGIVVLVVGVLAFGIKLIFGAVVSLIGRGKRGNGPENRLFDFGSIAFVSLALVLGSLEGLPNSYSFMASNESAASSFVNAQPTLVWEVMEQATSPEIPLPAVLGMFPKPGAVVKDEGTALGALRRVKFQGREGVGYLTLKVVERSDTRAVFMVLSDSSPYSHWVKYKDLTYELHHEGVGSRLTVTLQYERLLAPAWFFNPVIKGAAYLAMDVLVRDVKFRSEQ